MSSGDWNRVGQILGEALSRSGRDRDAYLDRACQGDPDLRTEVESFLEDAPTAEDYFADLSARVGLPPSDAQPEEPLAGRTVGPYRLVHLIGRGGMGVVYEAEREDQQFSMRTAVKLLPAWLDSPGARRRFLSERQILARLRHPGIAALLDGGVSDEGSPYFVMERVDGVPIDAWCDGQRLGVRERVELLLQVCEAVDFAHRSLVVHRDLKPRNILVTGAGRVKLLDFGIARLVDSELDGGVTRTGVPRAATPAYASPEQLRGDPPSTACDVYALGVLLVVLITGRHPIDVQGCSPAEAERRVMDMKPRVLGLLEPGGGRDEGPDLDEAAGARDTTPVRLRQAVAGDLEAVALQALRKDPADRYPSVGALAQDLGAYLESRPVSARAPGLAYRTRRFVARHRVGVAAGGAVALLALALVGLGGVFAVTTARQSRLIAQEAGTARDVSDFLVQLFQLADPDQAAGDTLRVRAVLDRGAERLDADLADQPQVRARIKLVMAQAYANLGFNSEAERLATESFQERVALYGEEHRDVAESLELLAWLRMEHRTGPGPAQAVRFYARSLEIREAVHDPELDRARTMSGLAQALSRLGEPDSAQQVIARALAMQEQVLAPDDPRWLGTLQQAAAILASGGAPDSAEVLYTTLLEQYRRQGPEGEEGVRRTLNNLGYLKRRQGDDAGAEAMYREILDLHRTGMGDVGVSTVLNNLAVAQDNQGKTREAEATLEERLDHARAGWPAGHWRIGQAHEGVATAYLRHDRPARAETHLQDAVRVYREGLGEEHSWTGRALSTLGESLIRLGRYPEARAALEESARVLGAQDPGNPELEALTGERLERVERLAAGGSGAGNGRE